MQRLNEMGVNHLTVAQTTNLLVYQRLLPTLCTKCKIVDLQESKEQGYTLYRPVGCGSCEYSGYQNRVLIAEALSPDEKIRETIINKNLSELHKNYNDENYVSLEASLLRLKERGDIGKTF